MSNNDIRGKVTLAQSSHMMSEMYPASEFLIFQIKYLG